MFWSLVRAVWRELNTPEDYAAEPVRGLTNQFGHLALAFVLTVSIASAWVQMSEVLPSVLAAAAAVIGAYVPPLWAAAVFVIAVYAIGIELIRQKWQGRDTISDTSFWSMGAVAAPIIISLTPSGRWIRVEEASSGFLIWLACAALALALYVWPRARRAYGGGK